MTTIISRNIKALCKHYKIKLCQFESEMGVSPGYFSRSNCFKSPVSLIVKVATHFDISVEELLTKDYDLSCRIASNRNDVSKLEAEYEKLMEEYNDKNRKI